jgi:hypothetical protein
MKNKLIKLLAIMFLFSTCVILYAANKNQYEEDGFLFDYGHKITITSKIDDIYNLDNACFLRFHKTGWSHPTLIDELRLIIFASDLPKFPLNLESNYMNKWVKVTGKLMKYQGNPAIRVTNPNQIRIVDAPAGAKPETEVVQESSSDDNDLAPAEPKMKPEVVKESSSDANNLEPVRAKPELKIVQQSSPDANNLEKQLELLSKTVETQESRIKTLEQRVAKLEFILKGQK